MKNLELENKNSKLINGVQWLNDKKPIAYSSAITFMEQRVKAIKMKKAPELVWLIEHPPLYTAGTSAKSTDLIDAKRFPVFKTGRGGQYTYHGPGQRVVYVMLDLNRRGTDLKAYVYNLEEWIIQTLKMFSIIGGRRKNRIGIWVPTGGNVNLKEAKIASIGIRIRHWITYHGVAININPNLEHFSGIIPCGISDYSMTSFADIGITATISDVDVALASSFKSIFADLNDNS